MFDKAAHKRLATALIDRLFELSPRDVWFGGTGRMVWVPCPEFDIDWDVLFTQFFHQLIWSVPHDKEAAFLSLWCNAVGMTPSETVGNVGYVWERDAIKIGFVPSNHPEAAGFKPIQGGDDANG